MSKCGAICEVFSRVCGYFRPVTNWNKGKQEEFKEIFGALQQAERVRCAQTDCYRFAGGKELVAAQNAAVA